MSAFPTEELGENFTHCGGLWSRGVVDVWCEVSFLPQGDFFDFYKCWLNRLRFEEQCEHHGIRQVNHYEAPQGRNSRSLFMALILNLNKGNRKIVKLKGIDLHQQRKQPLVVRFSSFYGLVLSDLLNLKHVLIYCLQRNISFIPWTIYQLWCIKKKIIKHHSQ